MNSLPAALLAPRPFKSLLIADHRDPNDPVLMLLDTLTDADERTEAVLRSFRLHEGAYHDARDNSQGRARLAVAILKRHANPLTPREPAAMTQAEANEIVSAVRELLEPFINRTDQGSSFRNYDPPTDPVHHIELLIRNGAILDQHDLDIELRANDVSGDQADQLRQRIEAA